MPRLTRNDRMGAMEKKTSIVIKAIEMARTIDIKAVATSIGKRYQIISLDPLFINAYPGRKQYALVEKYGVVVLINNSEVFERNMLSMFQPFFRESLTATNSDEMKVVIDPSAQTNEVLFNRVIIQKEDEDFWKILATLLAQSVGLDSYEKKVDQILDDFTVGLKRPGTAFTRVFYPRTSAITQNINEAITLHQDIIANLGILDKPDAAWNRADLDDLYHDFSVMMEIPDRISVLERKLELLKSSMSAALDIASTRRLEVLEWIIIILIALSIIQGLLGLY